MRRGLVAIVVALGVAPSPARADYAPVSQPGPKLSVPARALKRSLRCPAGLARAGRPVVLMVPPTVFDPPDAYGWNYEPALDQVDIPWCEVTVPNHTDGDIQVAAEYVVHAIRRIRKRSHHRVILFGWSQGGSTLPRWALRWWPDARRKVVSQVGIAPLHNRGSVVANGACASGRCVPAAWQQAVGSDFMPALNSRQQVFPSIAYTALYTRYDDVVTPDYDGALSQLPEGPNTVTIALQDVCPTDVSEHLTIPASNTGWALALDAFLHPGQPASVDRIDTAKVCADPTIPGVNDAEYVQRIAQVTSLVGPHLMQGQVDAEPPLACYVTASCARRRR
jgi:hypothetical protein